MKLQNSVIVVTGGASGLGAACVRRFHAAGSKVLICDLDSAKGEALASELGQHVRFISTDVVSEEDAARAIHYSQSEFGGVHGLINCAGIAPAERVLGKRGPHRLDSFARCIQINLIGTFNMIRLASAAMANGEPNAAGERGVIVSTASVAAYEGQIGQAAYSASKAGIVGMTLPLARELAGNGIRVMTIAPGLFLTPMMQSFAPEIQESLGKSVPFPPRLGQADEYAALVQHVIENEMLNGATIRLDGALRLAAK